MTLSKSEKKKLCAGCRSERYNMGIGYQENAIAAPVTCEQCWNLNSAKVVNKLVYYSPSQVKGTKKRTLSCWHNEFGYGERTK